jgi:NAD(P)-dependent dehydrogenase (short-subunit alcohol dehydrogenase family)
MFTKCAAIDLGQYGIRVNCIAPGNIETPILAASLLDGRPEEEKAELMRKVREYIISRQPLRRQGTTGDMAEALMYFASDRSSYITGTVLPVDGGMVAGAAPATASSFEETLKRTKPG